MAIPDAPLGASSARTEESLVLAERLAQGASDPEQAREAARLFSLEGHRGRAIDVLRQGILTHPRHAGLLSLLGDLLSRSGSFEEADLSFQKALECDPGSAEPRYLEGLHYGRQGHPAAAQTSYEEAVRLHPTHVKAWVNLGLTRADRGDRPGAVSALQRAVTVDPS